MTQGPLPAILIYEVWSGAAGLRRWWQGAMLGEFQSPLHDRQLLAGMPGLHCNRG